MFRLEASEILWVSGRGPQSRPHQIKVSLINRCIPWNSRTISRSLRASFSRDLFCPFPILILHSWLWYHLQIHSLYRSGTRVVPFYFWGRRDQFWQLRSEGRRNWLATQRGLGVLLTSEWLGFSPEKQVRCPGSASTHLFVSGAVGGL